MLRGCSTTSVLELSLEAFLRHETARKLTPRQLYLVENRIYIGNPDGSGSVMVEKILPPENPDDGFVDDLTRVQTIINF